MADAQERDASGIGGILLSPPGSDDPSLEDRALEAMLEVLPGADAARQDRVRRVMVGVFAERPVDDPIVLEYRKRLARALN